MEYISRNQSVLTDKKNLEHLYTLSDFPVFMGCLEQPMEQDLKADMSFSICKDTGIIQLDRVLPLELVYQHPHNDGLGELWQNHYREFAEFLRRFSPKAVLEIGGTNAVIAKEFLAKECGVPWDIIEPNPIFSGNSEIRVIKGWFDSSFRHDRKIDTIVHSHVLEHVYHPRDFLEHISSFLEPGEKHIFTFPNLYELLASKFTNCLNFEHTLFLTEELLDWMLPTFGFKILSKQHFRNHSIFYATEKTSHRSVPLPINRYEEYRSMFQGFLDYHIDLIRNLNAKIRAFDGEVFLFGGHIFSQYLFGFGLDPEKVSGVLDNSPIKNQKRLYGTRFTVDYPSVIQGKKKVAVILKVAGFRDEILNQLKSLNPAVEIFE